MMVKYGHSECKTLKYPCTLTLPRLPLKVNFSGSSLLKHLEFYDDFRKLLDHTTLKFAKYTHKFPSACSLVLSNSFSDNSVNGNFIQPQWIPYMSQ
ncbi:hypothetical protein Celaphus_00015314, partial [Cervus elaphus hippelaphus]